MKLHPSEKVNTRQSLALRAKEDSRLRKQAEVTGIPVFAWRLAAAQNVSLAQRETTVRHRHD